MKARDLFVVLVRAVALLLLADSVASLAMGLSWLPVERQHLLLALSPVCPAVLAIFLIRLAPSIADRFRWEGMATPGDAEVATAPGDWMRVAERGVGVAAFVMAILPVARIASLLLRPDAGPLLGSLDALRREFIEAGLLLLAAVWLIVRSCRREAGTP